MAAVTDSAVILDSRLTAYETEILKLKNENKNYKVDASEAKAAMTKLTNELKMSQETLKAIQTEDKTLKLSLKEVTNKSQDQKQILNDYTNKHKQLKIRVEENEKIITELRQSNSETEAKLIALQKQHDSYISELNMTHAKELGKLQNSKQNELDARVNRFAKIENQLKTEITTVQKQMNAMDRDYKDTIAGQAQRLCAYEQQINIMEKQMNRLSIENEFKSIPKLNDSERQIHRLESQNISLLNANTKKDNEIKDLVNRLNMTRLNQHYDFRNRGNF